MNRRRFSFLAPAALFAKNPSPELAPASKPAVDESLVSEIMRQIKERDEAPARAAAALRQQKKEQASLATGIPIEHVHGNLMRPDTCGCVLEFAWDERDADPKHIPFAAKCCEHHACHTTVEGIYTAALADNRAKNHAVGQALLALQEIDPAATHEDVQWEFDAERKVRLKLSDKHAMALAAVRNRAGVDAEVA
jgi:hypothetical protein